MIGRKKTIAENFCPIRKSEFNSLWNSSVKGMFPGALLALLENFTSVLILVSSRLTAPRSPRMGHLFAWASLSIIFLTYQLKLILYLLPSESKLLLRSELPVVTLGKSLPGNCSKLGHLFAWAFLSIIFLTYQLKLIWYLFPFESELLLRGQLPFVTLGKSLPRNCSKLGNLFAWAFLSIVFQTSQLLFVVELLLRT